VSRLGRRIWEDIQLGLGGALLGSVVVMLGEHPTPGELLHRTGRSLLEMVPCTAFGTELARGIHWLFRRYQARSRAKAVNRSA
jgi:hypothetical protein